MLTAAAWEPEPGGCRTMEIREESSFLLGSVSLKPYP